MANAEERYHTFVHEKVLRYIREHGLMHAGDRVAVAVSGGADSVALLRALLELRPELGVVLAVAHFNHGLRAEQSAADEAFVAELAKKQELEFFTGQGNVQDHAFTNKLSIEASGRELRYRWLMKLAGRERFDCIATAHTMDDQAETVLLKLLRGAGTRGLAGIYPTLTIDRARDSTGAKAPAPKEALNGAPEDAPLQISDSKHSSVRARIIRPLLCVSRTDVEEYLVALRQDWREDESNRDRQFMRNRVRHELLPLLEREYNPNIRHLLSDLADLSQGEEAYWAALVEQQLATRTNPDQLDIGGFSDLPLALQRRLLKRFAEKDGPALDFKHVEQLRRCALGEVSKVDLPGGRIVKNAHGQLRFCDQQPLRAQYQYVLSVPGEIHIVELDMTLRAIVVPQEFARESPPGTLLSSDLVGPELVVRNWQHGDRYQPAHRRSEEKLKRLFAEAHIPAEQRSTWPVALCDDNIVWVQGFPVGSAYEWRGGGDAVILEVNSTRNQ